MILKKKTSLFIDLKDFRRALYIKLSWHDCEKENLTSNLVIIFILLP